MGSAAMNANGDIALGYSVSSDTVFPEIRVTGRRSDDPLNSMTMEELTLVPGVSNQTFQRWGDYTSMDVDPADGETFWYTNMILSSQNLRSVWVGVFRLDSFFGAIFVDGFESGDTLEWSAATN